MEKTAILSTLLAVGFLAGCDDASDNLTTMEGIASDVAEEAVSEINTRVDDLESRIDELENQVSDLESR